jgi:hypothetical protein
MRKILVSALVVLLPSLAHGQSAGNFIRNDAVANINGPNLSVGSAAVDAAGRLVTENQLLARTSEPTGVANGANVFGLADIFGRTVVAPYQIPELTRQACGTATGVTSDVAMLPAVAGNRNYVTSITCKNTSTTVGPTLDFKDGTTIIAVGGIPATSATGTLTGSFTHTFTVPLRGTVNTAVNFATNTATTSVVCCANGYISAN